MKKRRKLFLLGGVLLTLIVIILIWMPSFLSKDGLEIRIATATPGGTFYPLGESLAEILSKLPTNLIKDAKPIKTDGSKENVELMTQEKEYNLAFVSGTILWGSTDEQKSEIRILARLYKDILQIVVRKDAKIDKLSDLRNKKIYIGKHGSSTRYVAMELLKMIFKDEMIYEEEMIYEDEYKLYPEEQKDDIEQCSYTYASEQLKKHELNAAIFFSGTPTEAVKQALESGHCRLLSLEDNNIRDLIKNPKLKDVELFEIPSGVYAEQSDVVKTIGIPVYLVAKKSLGKDHVELILDALFKEKEELLLAHSTAKDIQPGYAFPNAKDLPKGVVYHPGAEEYQKKEKKKLRIATGLIGGTYYGIGKFIREQLEQEGIPAREVDTEGSLKNVMELMRDKYMDRTLAILQYDVALALIRPDPKKVYNTDIELWGENDEEREEEKVKELREKVKGLRWIATLHEEFVYILARRDTLKNPEEQNVTLMDLKDPENLKFCIGPKYSGTQVLAKAILKSHFEEKELEKSHSSTKEMVSGLKSRTKKKIDVGFYVGKEPSEEISTVLQDDGFRLLSIDQSKAAPLTQTNALKIAKIPGKFYRPQGKDQRAINTISTTAILVTTNKLKTDLGKITEAVIRVAGFLGLEGEQLAKRLPSLSHHPKAVEVYREEGYLPAPPKQSWLRDIGTILGILGGLLAIIKVISVLMRDRISNELKKQILGVSVDVENSDAVEKLFRIQKEIKERARTRWWDLKHLDRARWGSLNDMINNQIQDAKAIRMRALVDEIHSSDRQSQNIPNQRTSSLKQRMWQHIWKGELSELQLEVVLKALEEIRPDREPED